MDTPLTADLTIAGPIDVSLQVSTTGSDGDWVVKVIDVYPGNLPAPMGHFQMLLAADILRAKFRNSMSRPEPMVPGQPTKLAFTLGEPFATAYLRSDPLQMRVICDYVASMTDAQAIEEYRRLYSR